MMLTDWIFGSLITIVFLGIMATSVSRIVTTCRQWRQPARRHPLESRAPPPTWSRVWRAYVGTPFRPFQPLRLAWDERGIFLIPSPLTQLIGFGPLYLPRQEIETRSVRKWGSDLVELAPRDKSCAVLLISTRAWRKSGLPLP
jgi:hypothetical protein